MSTLCGMIRTSNRELPIDIFDSMLNYLGKYPGSRVFKSVRNNLCFGNTIQPIITQDYLEQLPRYSLDNQMVIIADAIIDNRGELYRELQPVNRSLEEITNSELILEAYLKWDKEAPKHLVGDFAFAIWNNKKEELYLCRDHVGKRTLYYTQEENLIAFSTLINPLLLVKENIEYSEEWIANYLAVMECLNELDVELTFYEGIKQVPPATYMIFKKDSVEVQKYWNPMEIKPLKLDSDEAYEEAFREIFYEAVNCRIVTDGEVGIMLSGGLDSGSIACVAAKVLDKNAKHLKAYSSIPKSDYIDWLPKGAVANESVYINELASQYTNIDVTYCDSDKLNSYNQIERLRTIQEYPYKYSGNLFWIDRIVQMAKEDGCKVLLDGQSGNYTISYGDITSHIVTLIKKKKFHSAREEIMQYSKVHGRLPKSVFRYFILLYIPKPIKVLFNKGKVKSAKLITHIINKDLADKWDINRYMKLYGMGKYYNKKKSINEVRSFLCNNLLFSQAAASEVRLSIEYGLVRRDPTRDKRVIEFSMSLPAEQFVKDGIERSLIRRAMRGILPDKIRMNMMERGTQSADWIQRLHQDWNNIREEFSKAISDYRIKSFVDTNEMKAMISKMNELPMDDEYYEVQAIMTIINLYRFLV
ncbi:asparagine synthase-related protein [Anaeromicropila herbilytica]|uniref:asparagine synthase (glutamine-hydrolyzing) n=1 Tax=Anaeromicropila herbilytica TaxID=2785025 RepID=A0A7R7IAZ9_9FIRM|nr:asparagine synthase-related protein [Anaeromicropila herbilytica]BCN29028.1 asparagine synthetase B [Anaeromicropila herbilytica]